MEIIAFIAVIGLMVAAAWYFKIGPFAPKTEAAPRVRPTRPPPAAPPPPPVDQAPPPPPADPARPAA